MNKIAKSDSNKLLIGIFAILALIAIAYLFQGGNLGPITFAVTSTCSDSDHGLLPETSGYVQYGSTVYNDYCKSATVLAEQSCSSSTSKNAATDYTCGSCVSSGGRGYCQGGSTKVGSTTPTVTTTTTTTTTTSGVTSSTTTGAGTTSLSGSCSNGDIRNRKCFDLYTESYDYCVNGQWSADVYQCGAGLCTGFGSPCGSGQLCYEGLTNQCDFTADINSEFCQLDTRARPYALQVGDASILNINNFLSITQAPKSTVSPGEVTQVNIRELLDLDVACSDQFVRLKVNVVGPVSGVKEYELLDAKGQHLSGWFGNAALSGCYSNLVPVDLSIKNSFSKPGKYTITTQLWCDASNVPRSNGKEEYTITVQNTVATPGYTESARCGDGILNQVTEFCDGAVTATYCKYYNTHYQNPNALLKCGSNCQYDFSPCGTISSTTTTSGTTGLSGATGTGDIAVCGNGKKESGEACDGTDKAPDCQACTNTCECTTSACGNNKRDGTEACDGTDIPIACTDLHYSGGDLKCRTDCKGWDTSSCAGASVVKCNDGTSVGKCNSGNQECVCKTQSGNNCLSALLQDSAKCNPTSTPQTETDTSGQTDIVCTDGTILGQCSIKQTTYVCGLTVAGVPTLISKPDVCGSNSNQTEVGCDINPCATGCDSSSLERVCGAIDKEYSWYSNICLAKEKGATVYADITLCSDSTTLITQEGTTTVEPGNFGTTATAQQQKDTWYVIGVIVLFVVLIFVTTRKQY